MNKITPFLGFSEPLSSMSHLLAALFFLTISFLTIFRGRGNHFRVFSLSLYFMCNVFLYSMSGVYHLLEKGTDANYVLRILDHAGIFLMIAGSFTPFQIILLRGLKRWVPLITIWCLSIIGVTFTSIFFDSIPEWVILTLYISMGWMSVFTVWFIRKFDMKTVWLITLGGVFYTLGAVFDYSRWPVIINGIFEAHELFHIMIVIASLVHLFAIYRISHLPISETLTVIIKKFHNKYEASFATEKGLLVSDTKNGIKEEIKNWIREHFPEKMLPHSIKIQYFEEDTIDLD
jgi:channel protein (hemolysin III family)